MKFAVTSKGFLKEKIVNIVDNRPVVEYHWTNKLREAKQFLSSGKVMNWLKANNFEGFAYNPHEEEPIRDKYLVTQRSDGFYDERNGHLVREWVVRKASMVNRTDAKFLNSNDDMSKYYDKEEAERIALDRNEKMLQELISKVENFKKLIYAKPE